MDLLKNNKKKDALKNLEIAQQIYESKGLYASSLVNDLYKARKKAVKSIETAEVVLNKQPDFGIENIKKVADARASIRLFTEAILNEKKLSGTIDDPTGKYAGAALAGTTTGAAVATLGPSAAMAFATTFGTAATGTAISTLSGAAATNAALAWLGGGAVVAGGGGMAAGSIILALFGPIGLTIGAVTAGVAGFKYRNKNGKIADAAEDMTKKIKKNTEELTKTTNSIWGLKIEIEERMSNLNILMKGTSTNKGIIYNYGQIVDIIISLCSKINEKVTPKMI